MCKVRRWDENRRDLMAGDETTLNLRACLPRQHTHASFGSSSGRDAASQDDFVSSAPGC